MEDKQLCDRTLPSGITRRYEDGKQRERRNNTAATKPEMDVASCSVLKPKWRAPNLVSVADLELIDGCDVILNAGL